MGKITLRAWFLLLLLPLIPVVVLYIIFAGQNYFELKDTTRGIVAIGPIAAYVAIVILGWKVMVGIEKESHPSSPLLDELIGEWTLKSKSIHETPGKGKCFIENDRGALVINGDLSENGENQGTWKSEMTLVKGHNLYIFYTMTQISDLGSKKLDGICTLTFGASPINLMQGTWIIVGVSNMAGEMTLTRK